MHLVDKLLYTKQEQRDYMISKISNDQFLKVVYMMNGVSKWN